MDPLLSIVVPTKNRYYYLNFLVQYFHSIDSDKIELIIQDNSDSETDPEFLEFLDTINDHRIKYFYSSLELSQAENCDQAILKASGEYITLLGDDDIFSKHLIEFIEICKNKSVDAILPIKGTYTWPDVQPRFYKNNLSGIYRLSNFSGKQHKVDVISQLVKVIAVGGTNILKLPRVYHGVIKRTILEQIFEESGSYFPGPSPDMANAIALCKYPISYISVDIPLIISGQSISSAGGKGAQGQHFGEIDKIRQLPKNTAANWTNKVPFYWSGNTIYAESVVKALKRMNMAEFLLKFNYEYLYATCLVFDRNYSERVKKIIDQQNPGSLNLRRLRIKFYFILIWLKRILFHLNNNLILVMPDFFKQNNTVFQLKNILEVATINDELIKKKLNYLKQGSQGNHRSQF